MLDLSDYEFDPEDIDPINNDEKFAEFCCELVKIIWEDPTACLLGVSGQNQNGVDITARYKMNGKYWGVQCKKRSQIIGSKLTEGEIRKEVEKALEFEPKLGHYEIFTTMRRDAKLQEVIRKITFDNEGKGLFSVQIKFWEDIINDLLNHRELLYRYYPHLQKPTETIRKDTDLFKESVDKSLDQKAEVKNSISNYGSGTINVTINESKDESIKVDETLVDGQIDSARDLLDSGNIITALKKLEDIKKEKWSNSSANIKYRLLTNIAVAKSKIKEEKEASKLFIEALQYNPDDEKALCNAVTGYLLQENKEEANKIIEKILEKNPASDRGYSLKIYASDDDRTIDEIISEIPKINLESDTVSHSIGFLVRSRGDYETAIDWFEKSLSYEKDKKDIEIKASLAETMLQTVIDDQRFVHGEQLSIGVRSRLERSEMLFKEVWDEVSGTEEKKFKTSWLLNRGIANMLLGNLDMANRNLDEAFEIDPDNSMIIKQKAVLLFEKGEKEKAVELIKSIKEYDKKPEITIPFISFLGQMGLYDEAINLGEILTKNTENKQAIIDTNRIIADMMVRSLKIDKAKNFIDNLIKNNPDIISYYISRAKICLTLKEKEKGKTYLLMAKEKAVEELEERSLIELGNIFYNMEEFKDASDVFEIVADKEIDSDITRKLLNSYYRLGKGNEALEITASIKPTNQESERYLTEIRSAIFLEIGDWINAKTTCEKYLAKYKNDFEIKIRYGMVLLKSGKNDDMKELKEFLEKDIDTSTLSFNSWSQLISLYESCEYDVEAIKNAYEVRRKFFNKPEAHMQYVGLFFRTEKKNRDLFIVDEVKDGTSVLIGDTDTVGGTTYILDDRDDADLNKNEINSKHPLYNKLLGKKNNDIVQIRTGDPGDFEEKIKEVKSKYIYALHDSMNNFNSRFPTTDGLWSFKTKIKQGDDSGNNESIKPILDKITKHSQFIHQVEDLYKEGKLTIGAISTMIGRDILTVWGGLSSSIGTGIRSSNGTLKEMETAFSLIRKKPTPQLIIDPISLMTLHGIDMADKVIEFFGKPGIASSTVELLRENIREKKGIGSEGYMTIGKEGEDFFREEITPEQIDNNIKYLQKILDWIDKKCEIIPCTPALGIDREKREQDQKMLGIESYESVLIASQENKILYSDDERLRSLSKITYKCNGVWTQLLLLEMLNNGFIKMNEYSKVVLKLLNSNYYHTSINKDILIEAGNQSGWKIEKPLTEIMAKLGEGPSDLKSSVLVGTEFLSELWNKRSDIEEETKKEITKKLLKIITDNRSITDVIYPLKQIIERMFVKNPTNKEKIFSLIRELGKDNESLFL